MSLAIKAADRSTCDRARVGCVIAINGHILSTGYNGSLPNQPHCDDAGHLMKEGHCIRTVHAEMNAIAWAARKGISIEGVAIFCTHFPCRLCAQTIISAGIVQLHYINDYRLDTNVLKMFRAACVLFSKDNQTV